MLLEGNVEKPDGENPQNIVSKTNFTTQEHKSKQKKTTLPLIAEFNSTHSKLGEFQAGNNIVKC